MSMNRVLVVLLALVVSAIGLVLLWERGDRNEGAASTRGGDESATRTRAYLRSSEAEMERREVISTGEARAPQLPSTPDATGAHDGVVPEAPANDATLRLLVVRADVGTPLPHCRVVVWEMGGREVYTEDEGTTRETDLDGRASTPVAAGISLLVKAGGIRPSLKGEPPVVPEDAPKATLMQVPPLEAGTERLVRVAVTVGCDQLFYGRIVQEDGGAPIGGARIVPLPPVGNALPPPPEPPRTVVTTADGRFSFAASSWRMVSPRRIEAEGFGAALFMPTLGHESLEDALELPLTKAAEVRAIIRGTEGAPLSMHLETKAGYVALPHGSTINGVLEWHNTTDPVGYCAVVGLPARAPIDITVRDGSRRIRDFPTVTLEPGEVRELELNLAGHAAIRGRVVDQNGSAVADLEVWLLSSSEWGTTGKDAAWLTWQDEARVSHLAKTDGAGAFSFEGVAPGTWWIGPRAMPDPTEDRLGDSAEPIDVAPEAKRVEVIAGASNVWVELDIKRGLSIGGTVLGPDGSLQAGRTVIAFCRERTSIAQGKSAKDGSFEIGPLLDAEYSLFAKGDGSLCNSGVVRARAGGVGVTLKLQPSCTVSGVVVDGSTGRGAAAMVWIYGSDPGLVLSSGSATGEDGRFEIRRVAPGCYELVASRPDGAIGTLYDLVVDSTGTAQDLRIQLERGARLSLRCNAVTTYASFCVFAGSALVASGGVRTGTTTTLTVPPGTLRVELSSGSTKQEREVQVAPGDEIELVFDFL